MRQNLGRARSQNKDRQAQQDFTGCSLNVTHVVESFVQIRCAARL